MTDRWMEEAREMAISLGRDYPDVVERIAKKFSAAHEAGRREEREAADTATHVLLLKAEISSSDMLIKALEAEVKRLKAVNQAALSALNDAAIRNQYREAVDSINRATDAEIEAAVSEKERRDGQMTVAEIRKRKADEREFQDAIRSREVKS